MLRSIEESIWRNAELYSDKLALISGKKNVTYGQLVENINKASIYFKSLPYYKLGSAVIIAASKQLGFAYAYFGAHMAGLKTVPLDSETNPTRFQHIIDNISPICIIGLDSVETSIPTISLKAFEENEAIKEERGIEFPRLDNVADILFTTGTTGAPKGVPLTFRNEAAAARNINTFIQNSSNDIELLALPISHSFGLGRMRCCLVNGQTLILQGNFVNVKRIYRIIEEQGVTGFTMVPASWKFLRKMSGDKLGDYAAQLRYIEMGSAYFSAEDKQHLADLLPNTRVTMHYGLTEASRSAFMEFHEDAGKLATVGKASPFTDIKIFDENGAEMPTGVEGEICVKGEHVMCGYINVPNDCLFWDGYFRTGDWGTIDGAGYITLKSRKKELINVGGKKVSPSEVEGQLLKIDGIEDCACVATPDPNEVLGEVVKAYVVVTDDFNVDTACINEQLQGKLESYKLPVVYERIDAIPRTQNGKILRNQLL